nr:hypothetical protein [uncultured Tyzzerella sp.]
MNKQKYLKKIEKIAFFLKEIFEDLGFETKFEFKENNTPNYTCLEYATEANCILRKGFAQYSVYFFENSKRIMVDAAVGHFSDRLELSKIFEIQDAEKNLDFIKETIYQYYINFMK